MIPPIFTWGLTTKFSGGRRPSAAMPGLEQRIENDPAGRVNPYGLGRRIAKRAEHGVDTCLIARTLGLEPFQNICVNPQGN